MTDDWRGIQFTNRPYNEYERETMNTNIFVWNFQGTWTTEPPTVKGQYWIRGVVAAFLQVAFVDDMGFVWVVGYDKPIPRDGISHWLGPLPEPEMPK